MVGERGFVGEVTRRERPDHQVGTRWRRTMPKSLLLVHKGYRSMVSRPNARVHGSWVKREGGSSRKGTETAWPLDRVEYG
jgi:hypothetical protein